jgi:UDP-3-O-[3-hydroxymyristoyl] N-acetylglucosamine deacetylase
VTRPLQGTVEGDVVFQGVGIHTGQDCQVTVRPAAVGSGRRFVSAGGVEIQARVDNVVNCDRSTILGVGTDRVHTPEHLLSALVASGVDNAVIEMTGPEVPILDGSAAKFYEGIQAMGVRQQKAVAKVLIPTRPFVVNGAAGQLVLVTPATETLFEYVLHYDHPMLGCQTVEYRPKTDDYRTHIAPARTFALWEEVKPLIERGLAQGGSIENALVVFQDRYSSELTVEDEPVRHKCLDLIGDFALLDARIQARILAVKAGHRLHIDCATAVWKGTRDRECA